MKTPTKQDEALAKLAKFNGCIPKWYNGMFGWRYHCGCIDDLHCCDQQCSVLTKESASVRRHITTPDFLPESI